MLPCIYGSQTEQAYSILGRTRVLYAAFLTEVDLIFRFLLRNPMVLLALLVMLLT